MNDPNHDTLRFASWWPRRPGPLDAEIRLGELLAATDRAKGGQPYQKKATPTLRAGVENDPPLADLGISWKESSRAKRLARVPDNLADLARWADQARRTLDNPLP